ncbi:hypothetical protein EVAR_90395_1 [Eumeta japonica]|uniref:Uncharacterized protein n=1 Tax=Eumeta variegata TaxID=151549 RepID=A0A4C1ZV46_EUMVA|nr:hypothetical protein EVAR_90395_1 [Eumeta japonica]
MLLFTADNKVSRVRRQIPSSGGRMQCLPEENYAYATVVLSPSPYPLSIAAPNERPRAPGGLSSPGRLFGDGGARVLRILGIPGEVPTRYKDGNPPSVLDAFSKVKRILVPRIKSRWL